MDKVLVQVLIVGIWILSCDDKGKCFCKKTRLYTMQKKTIVNLSTFQFLKYKK